MRLAAHALALNLAADDAVELVPEIQFDLELLGSSALLLAIAFLVALPVGWEREQSGRSAGLRTFPLVALSSCAYVLVSVFAFGDDVQAQARVLQGLITGIGFVGGGAILKSSNRVKGTATATSVWTTGAIGASVAHGRVDIAVLLSLFTVVTLRWLHRLGGTEAPPSDAVGDDEDEDADQDV